MSVRMWWSATVLVGAGAVIAGCESTQDRSAQLRKEGNTVLSQRTQTLVTRPNPYVRVLGTATLHDQNGSAAVVELRNTSRLGLAAVPVAIDVRGASGASVFRNNAAGHRAVADRAVVRRAALTSWPGSTTR